MSENFAKVNGINLCYYIEGIGFPLILIHGFGAKKEIWNPQLFDLTNHFKVITYDIRGVGKSDRPDIPYTMDMLVEDLKGLIDYLKIKKTYLGGRSLGGMIAQNFTLKYASYVEKLILITTNSGLPDESAVEMMIESSLKELELSQYDPEKAYWQKARLLYHQKFRKQMEQNPSQIFYGNWSVHDQIAESKLNPPRPQDIINLGNTFKTYNSLKSLHKINCPTLLIAGTHDKLTPKISMEQMHEVIPNSRLNVIKNTGHFLTLSNAYEVNKDIFEFLKL